MAIKTRTATARKTKSAIETKAIKKPHKLWTIDPYNPETYLTPLLWAEKGEFYDIRIAGDPFDYDQYGEEFATRDNETYNDNLITILAIATLTPGHTYFLNTWQPFQARVLYNTQVNTPKQLLAKIVAKAKSIVEDENADIDPGYDDDDYTGWLYGIKTFKAKILPPNLKVRLALEESGLGNPPGMVYGEFEVREFRELFGR